MSIEYFLTWFAVIFPLVFSPGPANITFAISGEGQGFKKSIPLLFGVDLVYMVCVLLIGFGLGELFRMYPNIAFFLKFLGISYLFYLSFKFLRPFHHRKKIPSSTIFTFYDGVFIQTFNPKGWTMLFLMFSLFVDGSFNYVYQVIFLVIMVAVLNIFARVVWIAAGSMAAKFISNDKTEKYINYFFSISLLFVAIWLFVDILN